MFLHVALVKTLRLEPRYFGPNIKQTLRQRLHQEVEGRCLGDKGFVISVTGVDDNTLSEGKIDETTGQAVYEVRYTAVVLRPYVREVLDVVVSKINQTGVWASVGPLNVVISQSAVKGYTFDQSAAEPCYSADDKLAPAIVHGSHLRVRVLGLRVDVNEIFAVGTTEGEYLGVI